MAQTKVALQARRQEALKLALSGHTVREIGDKLKCAHSTAHRYVLAALAEQAKLHDKQVLEHRELMSERYNKLLAKWMEKAEEDPESTAGDKVLRALEGLRKLYGLDKPHERPEIGVIIPVAVHVKKVYVLDGEERAQRSLPPVG